MPRILNKKETKGGFTLIEVMVSVSIFVIVVMISMGAIFSIVDATKKAQSLKSVMNNLNFALETMTRTIKTGQIDPNPLNTNSTRIQVVDQSGYTVVYRWLGAGNPIERCRYISFGTCDFLPITAPEVQIQNLKFIPVGVVSGDPRQPMIVMILQGKAQLSPTISSIFNIQTTITQRLPK